MKVAEKSHFKWTPKSSAVALGLAEGKTQLGVAAENGINRKTIQRWLGDVEFAAEVDRLSLMVGIASRAERLRIAMRAARQMLKDNGQVITEKDLLDWLKFAQSETDGIKLSLTAIADAYASLAGGGQDRSDSKEAK